MMTIYNVSVPLVRRIYPGVDVKYPLLKRFYPKLVDGMTDDEIDARIEANKEDPRKTGLKNGLRQLSTEQIQRVIDYPGEMVLDTFNYENGNFCPLAIALELDKTMQSPTHEKVFDELIGKGYKVYNTRGIEGDFYTTNRLEDLKTAAQEVLEERLLGEK